MKKETSLKVLQDIRDRLDELIKQGIHRDLKIISHPEYFTITDDGSLKTSEIIQKCKDQFSVYSWYDMNQLDKDFPAPTTQTTRKFKRNIEADEELKDKSADDLEKEGIQGITLRERLLMELQYFAETSKHLDIDNVTLCTGSRHSDGSVPSVGWRADDQWLCVFWDEPAYRAPNLRSRACISK